METWGLVSDWSVIDFNMRLCDSRLCWDAFQTTVSLTPNFHWIHEKVYRYVDKCVVCITVFADYSQNSISKSSLPLLFSRMYDLNELSFDEWFNNQWDEANYDYGRKRKYVYSWTVTCIIFDILICFSCTENSKLETNHKKYFNNVLKHQSDSLSLHFFSHVGTS